MRHTPSNWRWYIRNDQINPLYRIPKNAPHFDLPITHIQGYIHVDRRERSFDIYITLFEHEISEEMKDALNNLFNPYKTNRTVTTFGKTCGSASRLSARGQLYILEQAEKILKNGILRAKLKKAIDEENGPEEKNEKTGAR